MKKTAVLLVSAMLMLSGTININAAERSFCRINDAKIAVRGRAAGIGKEEVTLLLIKEDDTIGHAAQTQTDDDGYYKFDFKFTKDNPEDYKLIVNRFGEIINETVIEAKITEDFFVDLSIDFDGEKERLNAFISECFGEANARIMLAQYNIDGRLIAVSTNDITNVSDSQSFVLENTINEECKYIKGFAWCDMDTMQAVTKGVMHEPLELQKKSEENTDEMVKIACIGDSITWGYGTTKQYHSYMSDKLNIKVQNLGISGTTISKLSSPFVDRVAKVDKDTDLIIVFGGVNDRNANVALGQFGDIGQETFYGAADLLINTIRRSYPDSKLVLITPLNSPDSYSMNSDLGIEDYANALIDIADRNCVPIIDAYHELDLTGYFPDNLHPNEAGHELLANYIIKKLEEKKIININEYK